MGLFMKITLIFITLYFIQNLTSAINNKVNDVRNHLGTRTPYRYKYNKNDSKLKYPNCKDKKIWMIVRHGTRFPSAKDILGMNSTLNSLKYEILLQHKLGKGELNAEQLKRFEDWASDVNVEKEKYLTYEGEEEMILLAERMQKRFPNIIKTKYNNKTFFFRYTATQRAQQSAKYFTVGLFDRKGAQDVIFAPASKIDPILRFYKHCDKWQKQVKRNPKTYEEQKTFGLSTVMNETLASVSKRLGLNYILHLDKVNLMYKICGYETSWNKHFTSPWCYAFDIETAKIFEYYHDLKHYWFDGYGHNITYQQACVSIKTMFDSFSNKGGPNATFLFAHSGTLLKILSHMQLYKPNSHLRGDAVNKDRKWRTSNIDCFASNLAFVLFKCKDGDYVLTLHQERVIQLPMCDKELCPLEHLKEYFHDSIFNCDYSAICNMGRNEL